LDEPELEADSSDFPGRSELRPAWTGREKCSTRRNEVGAHGAKRGSRSTLECLMGFARGARPAGVIVARTVEITQPGRSVRRPQQQQEECPVSPVFGGGPAAFRTLHDNLPFGRAHAPPPSPASLLQDHFKNRKLVGHCHYFNRSCGVQYLCVFHLAAGSNFLRERDKNLTKSAGPRGFTCSSSAVTQSNVGYREATTASSKII
jgi:hypothetical protein